MPHRGQETCGLRGPCKCSQWDLKDGSPCFSGSHNKCHHPNCGSVLRYVPCTCSFSRSLIIFVDNFYQNNVTIQVCFNCSCTHGCLSSQSWEGTMLGHAQLWSDTRKHNVFEMCGKHHSQKLFWLKLELITRSFFKNGKEKEDEEKSRERVKSPPAEWAEGGDRVLLKLHNQGRWKLVKDVENPAPLSRPAKSWHSLQGTDNAAQRHL